MAQRRSTVGRGALGGQQGSAGDIGELGAGLTDLVWGDGPKTPERGRIFRELRPCVSTRNTPSTSGAWVSATVGNPSDARCSLCLNCCASLSGNACRAPTLMALNLKKLTYARLWPNMLNAGRMIPLSLRLRPPPCPVWSSWGLRLGQGGKQARHAR